MRSLAVFLCSLTVVLVSLCGCDGNSVKAPSALAYTTSTVVYTKGVAIAPDSPKSSGGAVTSYSVSPALPEGLVLNAGTGIVSGTPSAVTAAGTYLVTASGAAGSATAFLSITVNDQPPTSLGYATGTAVYPRGAQIAPNVPTNGGGVVISYSVTPALPSGLNLSANTGIISGAPTAATAATSYTVTATNSGGSTGGRPPQYGRNVYVGHPLYNTDFRIMRDFTIMDKYHLQFLGEAFNIFNHTNITTVIGNYSYNFTNVGTGACSSSLASGTNGCLVPNASFLTPATTTSVNGLYGPRQLQVSAKFVF